MQLWKYCKTCILAFFAACTNKTWQPANPVVAAILINVILPQRNELFFYLETMKKWGLVFDGFLVAIAFSVSIQLFHLDITECFEC